MDLKNLIPTNDTVELVVKHPSTYEPLTNEDGSEMTITFYAPHTKEYKSAVHEQTNMRLKQMQGKRSSKNNVTAEEIEASSIKLLAKVTKDWNITFGGKKPKLDVATALDLYKDVFWLRDQADEAFSEAEVFTQA